MANPLPIDQVRTYRQQKYTDNQIVQQLQKQGFSSQQIFDAMAQADVAKFGGAQPAPPAAPQASPMPPPPAVQPAPPPPAPEQYPQPAQYPAYPETSEEKISEVAEIIINEKWEELISEVKKITDWKETIEANLQKTSDEITHLKEEFSELRKGILGKVTEYDEHMRDVGSELKAVEKVFKDTIPSFTENIRELSRLTKTMKSKKS